MTENRAHPAIRAREAMLELATLYPTLITCLGRPSGSGLTGRTTGTPERPLPYIEPVSAMLGEISHFTWYLVQRLIFESDPRRPIKATDLPEVPGERLAAIARDLIGHFAPDEGRNSEAFAADVEQLALRANRTAYPSGARWVDVPNRSDNWAARRDTMGCAEPGCTGRYRMRLDTNSAWGITVADPNTWPPLTCSSDKAHIVTGVELAKAIELAKVNGTAHLDELMALRAA